MKKTSTFSIAMKVTGIHIGVIGVIVLYSLLNGCFKPEPKNEVIMFVELAPMGPAMGGGAEPAPLEEIDEEESEIIEEVEVIEDPIPPDDSIPEPPDDSTPEIVEPTPDPPKKDPWKLTPVIPSNERVEATPNPSPRPIAAIDPRKILEPGPAGGAIGSPSEFASYESRVKAMFEQAWNLYKPSAGGPAWVRINFRSDGTITSCRLRTSSGEAAYDDAAQRAAASVSRLPKPPSGYGKTYLDIKFELTN